MASWSVQQFLHSSWQHVPILHNGPCFPLSKLHRPTEGSGCHLMHEFLGPIRAQNPNGISICSSIFFRAHYSDRPTDRPHYMVCNNRPHLCTCGLTTTSTYAYTCIHTHTNFILTLCICICIAFSALTQLGVRKSIQPVKRIEWWGAGVVVHLQWGANDIYLYAPIDATATPSSLASLKSWLVFSERELQRTWTHVHVRYMLSPVRLSSVTFVCPTQAVQIYGNISTALGTLAIYWHPLKISWRLSQGNPSAAGVKHKRGSQV